MSSQPCASAVAIGVVLTGPLNNDAGGLAFLLALVVTLAVIIIFSRSNWVLATRAHVSRDGQWVQVNGCAEFDRAASAVQQAVLAGQPVPFGPSAANVGGQSRSGG
ncbi:MAG: hypothetical protein E6F99_25100 [Actinobacteria bacterium]|nr:MAG: hypothetical protein E6F99_25100 [Actinomycetota bacterium]